MRNFSKKYNQNLRKPKSKLQKKYIDKNSLYIFG